MNINKIEKYKKLKYKVSKNKQTTDEDKKTNKYTRRLRYIWKTILKLKNAKKLEVQSIRE